MLYHYVAFWPAGDYQPNRKVNRAEFAALLNRLTFVFALDPERFPSDVHDFSDIRGHGHEQSVARLSNLGVLRGFPDGTFRPDGLISRAQMASMLVQMADLAYDLTFTPLSPLPFADLADTTTHVDNIALIAGAGITQGVSANRFDPTGHVTRGQVTTFVSRLFGILRSQSEAPPQRSWQDLATASDPAANSAGRTWERRDMFGNLDYATYPLCTEDMRAYAAGFTDRNITSSNPVLLGFDTSFAGQSCQWTRPGSDVVATVRRYPASAWTSLAAAAPGQCQTLNELSNNDPGATRGIVASLSGLGVHTPPVGDYLMCAGGVSVGILQFGQHVYWGSVNVPSQQGENLDPQFLYLSLFAATGGELER